MLEDQFGNKHHLRIPLANQLTVFVLADREGASQVRPWVESLYNVYGDNLAIVGVAVLPDVPRPIQATIKAFFRQAIKQPLFLDWGGKVASHFGYEAGRTVVLIVDDKGVVQSRIQGRFSKDKFTALREVIDRASAKQPKSASPKAKNQQHTPTTC